MTGEHLYTPSAYLELFRNWGVKRGIPEHSTALAQTRKTIEEVHELVEAAAQLSIVKFAARKDFVLRKAITDKLEDAIGDVVVTLVQVAECAGLDFNECLGKAWEDIKDRKGAFGPDGTWVKETN